MIDAKGRCLKALGVSWFALWVNLALTILKILAGLWGRSSAMVADGLHSMSDLATDLAAIFGFRMVAIPPDKSHKYGHGKFETLCQALIGMALMAAGAGILWNAGKRVVDFFNGTIPPRPGAVALAAALISIGVKEGLYRYAIAAARRLNSPILKANAWHHRSDALSSVGTLMGIGGSMIWGGCGRLLDPAAGLVVSFIVVGMGFSVTYDAAMELTEASLPEDAAGDIKAWGEAVPGVRNIHDLRTRKLGASVAMDFHLLVDPFMTVREGHDIATAVEAAIRKRLGEETMISVHLEPDEREQSAEAQARQAVDKYTPRG